MLSALHGATAGPPGRPGPPGEGAVRAGTGTGALGFKAGVGTASRRVGVAGGSVPGGDAVVGVLVQANFSGVLRVGGVPIRPSDVGIGPEPDAHPGNSCVIVIATDAAADARQLTRLARRAIFAMGRVGSDFTGGSGDYALAFSTVEPGGAVLPERDLEPLFAGVLEATEEALLNSLFMARTMVGFRGHVRYAVPHDLTLARLLP